MPLKFIDEVILVDDASSDETLKVAKTLPIIIERHDVNQGYGGNQKTCYKLALARGADVMVMVHPDHQYDPKFIPEMISLIVNSGWAAVFGSRMMIRRNALLGGMPYWKYFFNIILTRIGNLFLGTNLTEFHSGFRAYARRVFDEIDVSRNSDDFVFDTQIIIQMISRGMSIKEIPITTRYFKEASQISLVPSIRYGLQMMYSFLLYKLRLKKF
mgnify:FL=1